MSENTQIRLSARRKVPFVQQDEAAECGLACLAMVSAFFGASLDILSLRARFGVTLKGMSLRSLMHAAEALDLDARALRIEPAELTEVRSPAILHWDFNHFVVLTGVRRSHSSVRFCINDPARGSTIMDIAELSLHFTGVAVELAPTVSFRPRRERSKLSALDIWGKAVGLGSAVARILVLSVVVQLLTLAAPFYLQIAIDSVAPSHDLSLLAALGIGFAIAAIFNQLAQFIRVWAISNLSGELGYRMVSNLFRRLVRLPGDWFQKRSVGDVITRFNASQSITDLLGNGIVPAFVDGVMALVTGALMLAYSPLLSALAGAALVLYVAMRLAYFGTLRAKNLSVLQAQAREQAVLIETIRGITPIRIFGRERDRLHLWQNRRVAVVNTQVGIARMQGGFSAANNLILALENIAFVYFAVRMNLDGKFTIGMITAFVAYKQQFISAALNVVGRAIDYRMLDVQLNRIADIAMSPSDLSVIQDFDARPSFGKIEFKDVHFSYGMGEPAVLAGASFVVEPGESLAIVGPSGCGKTTILRLLLGLLEPSAGTILVDGRPFNRSTIGGYRREMAAVMQDDTLFAGSLAQNIAFFDAAFDMDRVRGAAKAAMISDDIERLPMGFDTLVGDMGAALSGGQKQRVLLARAIYHQPQLLVIDEGTAHLDVETEKRVNESLQQLGVTRVIVAHRPETIRAADRILRLDGGRLTAVEAQLRREHPSSATPQSVAAA